MEESVLRGMARWPRVPSVFGWLRLDRRGQWWIRQEQVRRLESRQFIGRNYLADEGGRWFFQNGPQRVYVTLDYTPWVLHFEDEDRVFTHTGLLVEAVTGCWLDDEGALLLETERGIGLLDDRDLVSALGRFRDARGKPFSSEHFDEMSDQAICTRYRFLWRHRDLAIEAIRSEDVPKRFEFQTNPKPD